MYILSYKIRDIHKTYEANSLDEILAMALHIFDESGEFKDISENDKVIYPCCEIYKLIKRCYY